MFKGSIFRGAAQQNLAKGPRNAKNGATSGAPCGALWRQPEGGDMSDTAEANAGDGDAGALQ